MWLQSPELSHPIEIYPTHNSNRNRNEIILPQRSTCKSYVTHHSCAAPLLFYLIFLRGVRRKSCFFCENMRMGLPPESFV